MDKNGDGHVTKEELVAMYFKSSRDSTVEYFIERCDKDGDKYISASEAYECFKQEVPADSQM